MPDLLAVKNWEYSTFHKFVDKNMYNLDWGSIEDSNSFNDLYED